MHDSMQFKTRVYNWNNMKNRFLRTITVVYFTYACCRSKEMKWMNLYQKGLQHKVEAVYCKNLRHILKT